MDAQLVDETLFERLSDDITSAHDHDVTVGCGSPGLVDRRGEIFREGDSHPQLSLEPNPMPPLGTVAPTTSPSPDTRGRAPATNELSPVAVVHTPTAGESVAVRDSYTTFVPSALMAGRLDA